MTSFVRQMQRLQSRSMGGSTAFGGGDAGRYYMYFAYCDILSYCCSTDGVESRDWCCMSQHSYSSPQTHVSAHIFYSSILTIAVSLLALLYYPTCLLPASMYGNDGLLRIMV